MGGRWEVGERYGLLYPLVSYEVLFTRGCILEYHSHSFCLMVVCYHRIL